MSYVFSFSYCSWGSQGKNTEVVCHSLLQWTTLCCRLECKVGSQETPGVTGTFGLGVQGKTGQRLIELFQEKALVIANNNTREDSTHGHHQMANTEIRLIIFFAAKDGEVLYSQQKQDWEQTVAQIMNSLLPNSDLN